MYIPAAHRETDLEVLFALMREHSFATLVTQRAGEVTATHLPFLLDAERGPYGTLFGHVARANAQWQEFEGGSEALVIFQGPHAYVSPAWYTTPMAVPTWNYAVVHAYGTPRIIDDPGMIRAYLGRLVQSYEQQFEHPWDLAQLPTEFTDRMMKGIVAFELPISRLDGKLKLSQNRGVADQQAVLDALAQLGDEGGAGVARLMERNLGRPDK